MKENKPSAIATVFFSATPFVLFGIFHALLAPRYMTDPSAVRFLAAAGLALSVLLLAAQALLRDRHYFPAAVAVVFGGYTALAFSIPVEEYVKTIAGSPFLSLALGRPQLGLYGVLFLMAAAPPLAGLPPFTNYFARRTTPPRYWPSALFRRINLIVTYFWACLFALCFLSQFAPSLALQIVIPVLLQAGVGAPLTGILVKYLMGRLAYLEREGAREYLISARDAVMGMPYIYDRKASKGVHDVYQFIISGEEEFEGYIAVDDGRCAFHEGAHPSPTLTLRSPAGVYLKIARRELPGSEAFLKKLYTLEGDLSAALRLEAIFGGGSAVKADRRALKKEKPATSFAKSFSAVQPGSLKKVFALLASPRAAETSKTGILLGAFLEGCREAGASVETVRLAEKKIHGCTGCFTCWTKTPGRCIHVDDAEAIMRSEEEADLVVFAYPLYHFGINSLLKNYIERTLPRLRPHLEVTPGGFTTHPVREGRRAVINTVILSVCGFPEARHFAAASCHAHFMAGAGGGDHGLRILGELYRPASEVLGSPFYREESERVLEAARTAGREVIIKGRIDTGLMDEIARVDFDLEKFRSEANMTWDLCVSEGKTLPRIQREMMGAR